jgi:RNA polymerase sigma-70 factor, ECF subfamily
MAEHRRRRAADRSARVEVVLKREAAGLLAYFERRVRPAEDAADLLSETMVVAWRRADVLPLDDTAARMWLYGVARNTLATHRRGQVRRDALAAVLRGELLAAGETAALDGRRDEDPRVDHLRGLIEALPELDREIFRLVTWEGFALAEVAELLDVPAGTIRSRYSRARASLKARLEQG